MAKERQVGVLAYFRRAGGMEILLARHKRGFLSGRRNGYGGKRNERSEKIRDTLARELREECPGMTFDPARAEHVATILFFNGEGKKFLVYVFFIDEWNGEPQDGDGMEDPRWYPVYTAPYRGGQMAPGDVLWLPPAVMGRRSAVIVEYDDGLRKVLRYRYRALKRFV